MRFDKLDFAVIDAESTAETKVETEEGAEREREREREEEGKKEGQKLLKNTRGEEKRPRGGKSGDQRKCPTIFICISHSTRVQLGRMAPIFIDNVRLLL